MFSQLWLLAHFLFLMCSVSFGPHLPESPVHALLLVLMSTTVLLPLIPWVADILVRALSSAPNAPPAAATVVEPHDIPLPTAPGTPGTTRAPSLVAHAFA